MKKRFVLTIALMLIAATLFAGVNFSGKFRQGYKFSFVKDSDLNNTTAWKASEGRINLSVSDENGMWSFKYKTTGNLDGNDKWGAAATVSLSKMLEAAGLNMGKFGATFMIGHNDQRQALTAYNDKSGDAAFKFRTNSNEAFQLKMNYDTLVDFNIVVDPTYKKATDKKATDTEGSFLASATFAPVAGVKVGAAYGYNTGMFFWEDDVLTTYKKSAINGSVDVDVAKLAGLDFMLGVSAFDTYQTDAKVNYLGATVYGGVEKINGFVEFFALNGDDVVTIKKDDDYIFTTGEKYLYAMKAQANFNVVKGLGLDAYYKCKNLNKAGDNVIFGGDVSYKVAGIEWGLNVEYDKCQFYKYTDGVFAITPKMTIVF